MLESKRRAIIFISISLILALVAGYLFLQKVQDLNENLGDTTKIYVAKENIPSREIIKPDQVSVIEIPKKFLTKSHVTNPNDITNKVSIVPLSEGDMITKNLLRNFSNFTDENNRLITLYRNERVAFDQKLEDQDRVDIIVSHQFDGKPKTEIFMSDIPVAHASTSDGEFRGVSLEISKEEAPKLIHMQNYADSIRVLKANVGKREQSSSKEKSEDTKVEKPKEEAPEKKQPVEQQPVEQQADKPANAKTEGSPAEKQQETPAEKTDQQKVQGQGK